MCVFFYYVPQESQAWQRSRDCKLLLLPWSHRLHRSFTKKDRVERKKEPNEKDICMYRDTESIPTHTFRCIWVLYEGNSNNLHHTLWQHTSGCTHQHLSTYVQEYMPMHVYRYNLERDNAIMAQEGSRLAETSHGQHRESLKDRTVSSETSHHRGSDKDESTSKTPASLSVHTLRQR